MISTERSSFSVLSKNDNLATIKYLDEDSIEYFYQGEVDNNDRFHGYGKLWNQDYSYHGYFSENYLDGEGVLTYLKKNTSQDNSFPLYYKGTFKKNRKNGIGLEKYYNKEFYEGNFLNDFRHGEGVLYNPNGKAKIESNWELGRSINTKYITEYFKNGNLEYRGNFNGIAKHGTGTLFNSNGTILFDGEFDNGKFKKGRLYKENNFILFEGTFGSINKPLKGTFYHENGLVQCSGEIKTCDGVNYITGQTKLYNSNFDLIFEGALIPSHCCDVLLPNRISTIEIYNEKYHICIGSGKLYFNNDKDKDNVVISKHICHHKISLNENFEFHGTNTEYYDNGFLKNVKEYENNKLNGNSIKYSPDFQDLIIEKLSYNQGKREGDYIKYLNNLDESILSKVIFENNKAIRYELFWKKNCKKYEGSCTESFNGILFNSEGKLYYNNENNSLQYEGTFSNSKMNGHGILYYQNSHKNYEGNFKDDKYHGIGVSFYETTGTVEYDGQWINGERHGEGAIWDESGTLVYQGEFQYGDMKFN